MDDYKQAWKYLGAWGVGGEGAGDFRILTNIKTLAILISKTNLFFLISVYLKVKKRLLIFKFL